MYLLYKISDLYRNNGLDETFIRILLHENVVKKSHKKKHVIVRTIHSSISFENYNDYSFIFSPPTNYATDADADESNTNRGIQSPKSLPFLVLLGCQENLSMRGIFYAYVLARRRRQTPPQLCQQRPNNIQIGTPQRNII